MCELLALSSSQPARLTFSLHTLAARGGLLGRSHDGWGVAFYEGLDVALYREPRPAADIFAHNGDLIGIESSGTLDRGAYRPVGQTDSELAFCDRRLQRNGHAEPPGLWVWQRRCPPGTTSADKGAGLAARTDGTSVVWVASVPLTDDPWQPLNCGELLAIRDGVILAGASTMSAPDRTARVEHAL